MALITLHGILPLLLSVLLIRELKRIMRLRVSGLLLAALALSACEQHGSPILRGVKLQNEDTPAQAADQQNMETDAAALAAEPAADTTSETGSPVKLNLTLPAINWDDDPVDLQYSVLPDVFRAGQKQSSVNWSGRLHLDESEEAKEKPVTDNILGAEVELHLRLP